MNIFSYIAFQWGMFGIMLLLLLILYIGGAAWTWIEKHLPHPASIQTAKQ